MHLFVLYIKFSARNPVINVEGELRLECVCLRLIGVTKLRNKIIVLGHSSLSLSPLYVVYVFDDQQPFSLQREIKFREIQDATEISSYEKEFCLYISDTKSKCIWKISPPDEDKIENGEFTCTALECPALSKFEYFTMTITEKGHILLIGGRKPNEDKIEDGVFRWTALECPSLSMFEYFTKTIADGGQNKFFGDQKPSMLFCESESAINCPIQIDLLFQNKHVKQLAENSAGNFIFLHRGRHMGMWGYQWYVSEVLRNGKTTIRQYHDTGSQWLNPDGLAFLFVNTRGRIFLADRSNHRLIFLDSRLRYAGSFTLGRSTDGKDDNANSLVFPMSIFHDGGKNQLIVAGEKKVLVYSFSRF